MKLHYLFIALLLCGCAGGPTKKYYNPAVSKANFNGPITMVRVENAFDERDRLVRQGYCVVGTTDYGGKHPEACELKAQAKRAGANHVIYSSDFIPAPPGTWNFGMYNFNGVAGGFGQGGGGVHNVHIVFMGK